MRNTFPASIESEAVRLSIDTHALCDLIEQHEMLTDAVHAMAQMFYVVKDERLLFCNQKLVDFLGLPVGVMARGTPWDDLLDALIKAGVAGAVKSPEAFKETVKKRHAAGKPYTAERELEDGRWLRIDVIPCPSQEIIVTYTEITELKHAQMKAQSAEKAKSAFLANMSHEIRTPMNGVMGMAELLCGTRLDSKQKAFADIILKSGEALLTIINDILDFSKIDAGKMTLHPAPFVLAEAIEDVATLISARIASKRLELAVRIDPRLPEMLVGDVGRLRQVITNLMGNAAKFTDQGHILVSVSGEEATGPDGVAATKLIFRVEDTGIGIPADKCDAIFEKFSQVDDSAARKHEGTGLGLAIASSLVKLMGGDIGVESKIGAGSTFWFSVNLPVHGEKRAAKIVPGDVSGARILVIDDNAVNRAILEEQLRAWRFDGAYCSSGVEGLILMREAVRTGAGYDLVILDHHMPQMTGADVAVLARNDPALAATPIIMLTSVDEAKDGSGFLSLGVEAHLVKPARSSLLFNTIVEVLQAHTRRVRVPAPAAAVETAGGRTAAVAQKSGETARPAARAADRDDRVDILVAEDNDVNRLVFIQILEDAGYSFRLVADGEEAVAAHLALKPRIVLMDVSMPKMNGFEATQAIRSADAKAGAHTPIIAVTAHAIKDDRERCLAAGMDDYVSKPISPARLRERIAHWIEESASAAA